LRPHGPAHAFKPGYFQRISLDSRRPPVGPLSRFSTRESESGGFSVSSSRWRWTAQGSTRACFCTDLI